MLALAYQNLSDIDDVAPLDTADFACLAELRQVLERHKKLDRFGVNLLHTHFPIGADEVLLETCDDVARSLTMTVKPASTLDSPAIIPTSWRLSDEKALLGCYRACVAAGGGHKSKHVER